MFKLIEKNVFPEQSGLVVPLKKNSKPDSNIVLDCFVDEDSSDYDIGLYYGTEDIDTKNKILISFNKKFKIFGKNIYHLDHPIRTYLEKWNPRLWDSKFIRWSIILEKRLEYEEYKNKIILNDSEWSGFDIGRLYIHSLERHIPVFTSKDVSIYDVYEMYMHVKKYRKNLSENYFINQIINICGRLNANKYKMLNE